MHHYTRKKRNHNKSKGLKKSGSKRNLNKKSKKSRKMNTRKIKGGGLSAADFDVITARIENFNTPLEERIRMYIAETGRIDACSNKIQSFARLIGRGSDQDLDKNCGINKFASYARRGFVGKKLQNLIELPNKQNLRLVEQTNKWIKDSQGKYDKYGVLAGDIPPKNVYSEPEVSEGSDDPLPPTFSDDQIKSFERAGAAA